MSSNISLEIELFKSDNINKNINRSVVVQTNDGVQKNDGGG